MVIKKFVIKCVKKVYKLVCVSISVDTIRN